MALEVRALVPILPNPHTLVYPMVALAFEKKLPHEQVSPLHQSVLDLGIEAPVDHQHPCVSHEGLVSKHAGRDQAHFQFHSHLDLKIHEAFQSSSVLAWAL